MKDTQIVLQEIVELIKQANIKIETQNAIVKQRKQKRTELTSQLWKYIVSELSHDIQVYYTRKSEIEKAICNLELKIKEYNKEKQDIQNAIQDLEKKITSIQPVCDEINKLLKSFGFTSFSLKVENNFSYSLVRNNGSIVNDNLSEGEKNFLCFIYFYYLLKGDFENSGIDKPKVVVIDDPVSSLDNDILLVVNTLVRDIIDDTISDNNNIKQVFFLTHNIYFYRQVTYRSNKKDINKYKYKESYYIIKKKDNISNIEKFDTNPIKTAYELLWSDISNDDGNNLYIQNTMRRIIEDYFKLIGGIDIYNDSIKKFDEQDRIIVNSLITFENIGSHATGVFEDSYYTMLDNTQINRYKDVFKQIFEKSGHQSHYDMMIEKTKTC